jgi:hypothetical protein
MAGINRQAHLQGLANHLLREPWICSRCGTSGVTGAEAFRGETSSTIVCVTCVAKATPTPGKRAFGGKGTKFGNPRGVGVLQPKAGRKRVSSSTSSFRAHKPMKPRGKKRVALSDQVRALAAWRSCATGRGSH